MEITIENISKIKKHRILENEPDKANDKLHDAIVNLMAYARQQKSKECVALMNNDTFEVVMFTDKMDEKVGLNNKIVIETFSKNKNTTFTVIHNHPSGNMFSIKDLETFVSINQINLLVVCGNDCKELGYLFKYSITYIEKLAIKSIIDRLVTSKAIKYTSSINRVLKEIKEINDDIVYINMKNY